MRALKTFPVSMKVDGRSILIIGAGEEAVAKARLAVKTSAQVRVVAPVVEADFADLKVELAVRTPIVADFDNAAMVFVTTEDAYGADAENTARRRGIPLNVVDVPHKCDFYTPAIVNRSPLTVAISSEGESPVLARLVRAKIEALLSPKLGDLAALAGSLRDRVSARLKDGVARRRYYERLAGSPAVERALDIGMSDALLEATGLLEREVDGEGAVWLIGAGPGSEDLLTLKAQRLLQEADIVVHEADVPELLVQMGRRDAHRVKLEQDQNSARHISGLLAEFAGQNQRVAWVRLGQGNDDALAAEVSLDLAGAGLQLEEVPGVSVPVRKTRRLRKVA